LIQFYWIQERRLELFLFSTPNNRKYDQTSKMSSSFFFVKRKKEELLLQQTQLTLENRQGFNEEDF